MQQFSEEIRGDSNLGEIKKNHIILHAVTMLGNSQQLEPSLIIRPAKRDKEYMSESTFYFDNRISICKYFFVFFF